MGAVNQGLLEGYIAEFKKEYPNITVTQSQAGNNYDTLQTAVMTVLPVNGQPNLVEAYGDHVAGYNGSGSIVPLDKFISNRNFGYSQAEIDDFIPGFWNEGKAFDNIGTMYTMPFSKSTEALYYNKTFFDTHGLEMPATPTWDDLANLARAIKRIPGHENSYPLGYDSEANMYITGSEQKKIPYTSFKENGSYSVDFNNQAAMDMVKYWRGLTQEGLLTTSQLNGDVYTSDLLKNETLFMAVGSTGGARYNFSATFETAVAPAPQFDLNNKKIIQQGPNITMFKKGGKQEMIASWLFMKFLTEPKQTTDWGTKSGYAPVRLSAYDTETYVNWKNAIQPRTEQKVFLDSIEMARAQAENFFVSPAFPRSSKCRAEVGGLVVEILRAAEITDAKIKELFQAAYDRVMY
jgi:multiple sugar transport system substrate-binding protein